MQKSAPKTARRSYGYPFAAIAGQRQMTRALLLAAIDPDLGGVLLRGEKGTAKSTAARGLARLLPDIEVVAGCALHCDPAGPLCPACGGLASPLPVATVPTPFVDLPLGASEDRLTGSMDITAAIKKGRIEFSPGMLGMAHRGVLYIDEVNLLPPHLVALILDAVTSGVNRVERESMSYTHPARFTLIASYNPEEGPLGPQLLDRFGLCVDVRGEADPALRVEVIKRRLAFEADPAGFMARWQEDDESLRRRLTRARAARPSVEISDQMRALAAATAARAGCVGQRGELALIRAARALAAWQGQAAVTREHIVEAAPMALVHRAVSRSSDDEVTVRRLMRGKIPEAAESEVQPPPSQRADPEAGAEGSRPSQEQVLRVYAPGPVKPVATRSPAREGGSMKQAGRRALRQVNENRGRYIRASAQRLGRSLALDATVRAAAPHQVARRTPDGPALAIRPPDIREKVRASKRGRLLLFLVDASGSMNAAARMRETKAAVLGILMEAYQKRDRVGLVAFGGDGAHELLPPTSSVEVAKRMLAELPTGGKTPLAAGLVTVAEILGRELAQDPKLNPLVVILSDGRPNVPYDLKKAEARVSIQGGWGDAGYADREVLDLSKRLAMDPRTRFVVVDTDTGHFQELNLCRPMAQYLGAPCTALRQITAGQVLDLVRSHW